MTPFKLKIITPDKVFFDGETTHLIARTTEGEIGILAKHENFVSILPPGPLRIKKDDKFASAAVSTGIIKVSKDKTTITATSAEWAEDIDIERAKRAEAAAREALKQKLSDFEYQQAELKLKRALNRLSVSSKL